MAKVSTGDKQIVYSVASSDGKFLAISHWRGFQGDDEAIYLFDVQAGKEIHRFGPKEDGYPVGFTSGSRFLIASELVGRLAFWDTATFKVTRRLDLIKEPRGGAKHIAISADGKSLVLEMEVRVPPPPEITFDREASLCFERYWCSVDVTTGKERWRTEQVKQTDSLAISPDGKVVACGMPGKIQLRNGDTGALLRALDSGSKDVTPWHRQAGALAFTSDGKKLLAGDHHTNVFVWDVATGKELHKLAGHRGRIFSISVSPDNTMFTTASEDSTVMVWRLE